ncbi:MAG: DUF3450 domain-containing protein [Gemmatimonadetes bacterium]|nr:DUF3450 domain-containing protein [Gemmatimonadota bacterium]
MPQSSGSAGGAPAADVIARADAQLAQLNALQQRRELAGEQYRALTAERGRIGQERLNAKARGDEAMVKEFDGTIARMTARIEELERTASQLDEQLSRSLAAGAHAPDLADAPAIADAPSPEPVAITVVPPRGAGSIDFALQAQRVEFQRMMLIEGGVLLLLGALLWRFGWARGRRQAAREQAPQVEASAAEARMLQAVDAIAIEVERLSEGQRFINNLLANRKPERDVLPVAPRKATTPSDGSRITPH